MQPAPIITFLSFVLELCSASPVYNMQPAFITTHIGTTGRNIRNLPCISRKTNEKGVCIFAMNCVKANGTHLGTCIDKFYFGSCCQLPTVNEIDNSIDSDIIPSREPPNRLSTLKPVITTLMHSTTTSEKPTTTTTTQKSTTSSTKDQKTTTEYKLSTEFNIQNFTRLPSIAEDSPDTETTTISQKLTTFLSINGSPSTTIIPETTKTSQVVTRKPKPTTTKITSKTTPRPTTKPSPKPSTKPVKVTSRPKPTTSTSKPLKTTKPTKTPTKRPVVTVKGPVSTRKPSTTTKLTRKPAVSTTTRTPTTTAIKTTTLKAVNATITTTQQPTTNILLNIITTAPPTVGEQITSNEIPLDVTKSPRPPTPSVVTTQSPSLVTWTVDESTTKKNISEEAATVTTTTEASGDLPKDENITTSSPKNNLTTLTAEETTTPFVALNLTTSAPSELPGNDSEVVTTSSITEATPLTHGPTEAAPATVSSSTQTFTLSTQTPSFGTSTTIQNEVTSSMNMSDFTSVCGRRMYPEARIVGGEKAPFGKWPWQISLRQWRTSTFLHKCGAALLNENWAITAAHCVDNVPPSDLLLRLGEHDLSTESEPYLHQERRVQIVASHPQFDPRTFEYDLALLRFYEPVTFQPNIIPVCVPQTDENFVGRTAYVTGWGRLYEDGPLPSVLQEVSVPVINNSVCESMYRSAGYIEHIPHIFICAGWRRGGFDSCEGDSGGPMVIQREDKRFLLAGVISWGIGCAEPNQPGVYTRISEFRDWINQILQF
ncbi:serine proteinase stubble isoform X2 [Coccinella septempunctata]|uniref:serine proteinase stubble isoform X2 n=1 Tax=Coccinella septempunctata TaxID=41139 RepID=UPI001D0741E8|nr:serine proteinase stubble isoform X2 [Coccinella septempunctata]